MRRLLLALTLLAPPPPALAQTVTPATGHSFVVQGDHFELDGHPFRILAGEMHYPRIPRDQWRDRMRKAKAMGLNTLTTYVFWDLHEPTPGHFDFSGNLDLAEYLREARQEGLYVILRPGPYVCAEWDFGGYPAWLLHDPTTQVRSLDPKFMQPATTWFHRLGEVIKPLLLANGGPIIAVQVENEYGSFGHDHEYMEAIHKLVVDSGMGGTSDHPELLYTADGGVQQANGSLPELPAVVNFGPGSAKGEIARLQRFRPNGPTMVGEYWAGWFDHWGRTHNPTNAAQQVSEYTWIISQGYSINLYMLHGGTSFGFMAGANSSGRDYEPDVTNYDYDAPINERGELTPKYFALRDAIAKVTGITPPPVPTEIPATTYPVAPATQSASLWNNLPKPIASDDLKTMEELGQSYGWILYTKKLAPNQGGMLLLDKVHDLAYVYLDHQLIGTLDRRLYQKAIELPRTGPAHELEILVEQLGRINYGLALRDDRKGLYGSVTLNEQPLTGWNIYSLPFVHPEQIKFSATPCTGPCFYSTTLTAAAAGKDALKDTFLDTQSIHNGFVWLNGKPLGRAWNVGPQAALFIPGSWLRHGSNRVITLDLAADKTPTLTTTDHTIWIPGANEPPPRPRPTPRPATPPTPVTPAPAPAP